MDKNKFKESQVKGLAFRRVCDKGVLIGLGISVVFFVAGAVSALMSDHSYRKKIRNEYGK